MVASKVKSGAGITLLVLADFLLLFLFFRTAGLIRVNILPFFFKGLPPFLSDLGQYLWIIPVWMLIFAYEGLYSKRLAYWDEVKLILKSAFITLIAVFSVLFVSKKGPEFSRILVMAFGVISLFGLSVLRPAVKRLIYAAGLMKRKVLIVGSGENAVKIMKALHGERNLGYEIAGFIDDAGEKEVCGYRVHRGIRDIEKYIKSARINDVIITKENLAGAELSDLINHVQHKAENTMYIPDFSGVAVSGTELKYFFTEQAIAIEIKNNLLNPLIYLGKRLADYLLALTVTIIFLPVLALIAFLIKRGSEGPAIYASPRIGKKAAEFNCYKFRTMYKDADERLHQILDEDSELRAEWEKYWKLKNDPRITPIGKFLRKTSLDELPQILNVLKGEMSLVGPRPYLPREWAFIKEESPIIHALPPGITGLWQVSGRNNQDYNYRIKMDSWYVKNWNLWLDIVILFKTVSAVLKREGAR